MAASVKRKSKIHSPLILAAEIILTIGVSVAFVFSGLATLENEGRQTAEETKLDYARVEQNYISIFKTLTIPIRDKVDEGISFDEMQAYLRSNNEKYTQAIGEDIFDGIALTYKGGYARSWDYGDYSHYDPTKRIWYQRAQEAGGEPVLVPPYVSYLGVNAPSADQVIEITVAQKYNDEVSFDLDLKLGEISSLINNKNASYDGASVLLYEKNGYILAATDSTLYSHNVQVADSAVSESLMKALAASKNAQEQLRFAIVSGQAEYLYTSSDGEGNCYVILVPFLSFFVKNLLLAMLIMILLIALECIIFIKNRQVISGMNRASVLQRHVLESIAYHYEAVFIGNAVTGKHTNIHSVRGMTGILENIIGNEEKLQEYAEQHVKEEYRQEFVRALLPKNVSEALSESSSAFVRVQMTDEHWYSIRTIRDREYEKSHSYFTFIENADEEMEHQLKLREALDNANAATAAKTEFLSRMSHDIRTPLNGIIGMTFFANKEDNPPATKEYLAKIDTSSKFLLGLVNDILDMSKVESNRVELRAEPYTFGMLANYLNAVIVPLCENKGISFVRDLQPDPDHTPLIDSLRGNQIIFNLFSNAVKYTPEGGTILFRFHQKMLPDGKVQIHMEITDNGVGMSEDFQKVLFEPFTQENRDDASDKRGTGLGLAIVKKMAELMGGTISVESKEGKGTTFLLDGSFECISNDQLPKNEKLTRSEHFSSGILKDKRVLVCEDHPMNQEIIRKLLENESMIVEIAGDGADGVKKFSSSEEGTYDVILMDIRMPNVNGYEATKIIRSLNRADAKTVPIIAMTADAFAEDIRKCLDAGMNEHIAKPIDPLQLVDVLVRFLSGTV
jgi:signal transduction histidine kinase